MAAFEIIEIDDSRVAARLGRIGPNVREALKNALEPLAARIGADARGRASAHIHLKGRKNPGSYLASIEDGVADKQGKVVGYVRSGHPLAHILEQGASTPPHDIVPDAARVLAFLWEGVGEVFARKVHHPGASIPAYPAILPAFDAARPEIEDALRGALQSASDR